MVYLQMLDLNRLSGMVLCCKGCQLPAKMGHSTSNTLAKMCTVLIAQHLPQMHTVEYG